MLTIKIKFQAFKRMFVAGIDWKRYNDDVYGTVNKIVGLGYIVYLDYDGLELDIIIEELKEMQELFGLSNFYIFESSDGHYHAVCFDKITLTALTTILHNSSADQRFITIPMQTKKLWTLRFSDKRGRTPRYSYTVLSEKNIYPKSKAHIDVMEELYPELKGEINRQNQDNSSKIISSNYKI